MRSNAKIKGLQYKANTVCLRGDDDSDFRFEIRIPNGGCDDKIWIDNIRLYGKIMEISKKIADIMVKRDDLSKEELKILNLKLDLQNKSLSIEKKLDILMELLFDDMEIRDIYYRRFRNTKDVIVKTGTRNYKHLMVNNEPGFDEVNIVDKASFGNARVFSYNPDTDEYSEYDIEDEDKIVGKKR